MFAQYILPNAAVAGLVTYLAGWGLSFIQYLVTLPWLLQAGFFVCFFVVAFASVNHARSRLATWGGRRFSALQPPAASTADQEEYERLKRQERRRRGEELKRRCGELANKLNRFVDGWEKYRDQPDKMFPEKPGEWAGYTMEQYRDEKWRGDEFEGENLREMLAALLDDLEQHGLLTAEQHKHFPVPTDDPRTIREAADRLLAISRRD